MSTNWEEKYKAEIRKTEDYKFCNNAICQAGRNGGSWQDYSYGRPQSLDQTAINLAVEDYAKFSAQITLKSSDDNQYVYEATVKWWQFRN